MRAKHAEKPRAAPLLTQLCVVVGMPVALSSRLSRGNYTHARADILSRTILVYELDWYTISLGDSCAPYTRARTEHSTLKLHISFSI